MIILIRKMREQNDYHEIITIMIIKNNKSNGKIKSINGGIIAILNTNESELIGVPQLITLISLLGRRVAPIQCSIVVEWVWGPVRGHP